MIDPLRSLGVGSVVVLAMVAPSSVVLAQDAGVIHQILVEGNQRVEPETVRTYLDLHEGDRYDTVKADKSQKKLFGTGLFSDVTVRLDGDRMVIKLVENPVINRLVFEGNQRVKSDQLQTEVQLRPRSVYTRTKVQSDVKRILDIYRRSGRFAATVEPKLIQLEQNRVDVVFEINEGPGTYVSRINFVGNKKFSDGRLREQLQTKEERWYRFLTQDDSYDPDRVTFDRELLRRHYLKNGYADFQVKSAIAELSADRAHFYITFTVDEGERYRVGKVTVRSALPDLKVDALLPLLTIKDGSWYNADEVENTTQALTDAVGNKGYAFIDVKPQLVRNRDTKTLDIVFDIQEGPRVFVERVDIQGNSRTLDKVIRREFRLAEGDAFNTAKLRRSKERIKDLDFFEKVEVNNVPSETAPDRTVIKVDVQEKSTGELSFGVGWSSSVGALIEIGARERNLLGRGQDIRINGSLAQKRNTVDLGFTEPYFLNRRLAAGFDIFAMNNKLQQQSSYDSTTNGGDLRAGYWYNEHLRHDWKYTASQTTIKNVQDTASTYIRQQAGTSTLSSFGHLVTWDHRDSRVDPTDGFYVKLGNEFAGLGGTEQFHRSNVGVGQYYRLADQWILLTSASAGIIQGWGGKDVRINSRYFLGGDTLRGFKDGGVSPRDKASNDALGALWQYTGTVELSVPLGLPKELGLQGKLFSDVGAPGQTAGNVDKTTIWQSTAPRVSVGGGIIWKSPMGPINIDLAVPLKKDQHDETQVFRLNFGTRM